MGEWGMGWASGEGGKKGKVSVRIIAAVKDHDIDGQIQHRLELNGQFTSAIELANMLTWITNLGTWTRATTWISIHGPTNT
jgi:hypothetical protein